MSSSPAINHQLSHAIGQILTEFGVVDAPSLVNVGLQTNPQFGHYTTTAALTAFAQNETVRTQFGSARALADAVAVQLSDRLAQSGISVTAAGPGFLNFTVSDHILRSEMARIVASNHWVDQLKESEPPRKVMVEYTDPNPFKELHIGHLFSNCVGEAISRLMQARGHSVKRACYQGDVGLHVAKSVWGMKQLMIDHAGESVDVSQILSELAKQPLSDRAKLMGQAYALGAQAYEEQAEAQTEIKRLNGIIFLIAQERVKAETDIQPVVDYQKLVGQVAAAELAQVRQLYLTGRQWSLAYLESLYSRLGTKFDYYFFESETGEFGWQIVQDGLKRGIFAVGEKGAIIFRGSAQGLHDRVFINALGLPTYEAKELGLAVRKHQIFNYDSSLIVTGNEIKQYFKVILAALAQIEPELARKNAHFSHGMVRLPEGKMSSRRGNVLTAEWLLDLAAEKIDTLLAKTKPDLTPAQRQALAQPIGLVAVKFALLKSSVGSDIAFDFDQSLSFNGFSGPYILYMLVRCKSILAKASQAENSTIAEYIDILRNNEVDIDLTMATVEKEVLRYVMQYKDIVAQAASEYAPHHITRHLFELAQAFSRFYDTCQVLNEKDGDKRLFRLQLTFAVKEVLAHGLWVLGLPEVEEM